MLLSMIKIVGMKEPRALLEEMTIMTWMRIPEEVEGEVCPGSLLVGALTYQVKQVYVQF